MRFKLTGILLLAAGAYLMISTMISLQQQRNDALTTQVWPLIAIFLVLLVRVLQAEKHHRDWLKQASDMGEKKATEEDVSLPPPEEIALSPLEEIPLRRMDDEPLRHDPELRSE